MSQIKRLLEVLSTTPDGELVLAPDASIRLVQPSGIQELTRSPITADNWRSVAMQLVPPFAFTTFEEEGHLESTLPLGGRQFLVRLHRDAEGACSAVVRLAQPALDVRTLQPTVTVVVPLATP